MGGSTSANSNAYSLTDYIHSSSIPTKDHVTSGVFSQHFFNINATNDPISDVVDAKFFYSEFHNPVTESNQKYFMIGLASSEDGKNKRDKMDVVIVIDRSGSMGQSLYDTNEKQQESHQKTKMQLTIESTKDIFEIFDEDEEIGIITFDNEIDVIESLKRKSEINKETLFESLNKVHERGGTNMEIGMRTAIQMLLSSPNKDRKKRILFITDDSPNVGMDEHGLKGMAESAYTNSNGTIGITYVGVGLSFNAKVSEELSKVHGTTIFNVNTSRELKETLVNDFNYLVSPIAFDVSVLFETSGLGIDFVYGGDADAVKTEELLHFRTMTASSISEKGVKGCAILIKLKEIKDSSNLDHNSAKIIIKYQPATGNETIKQKVYNASLADDQQQNMAISKAIALAVYYDTLKEVLPASFGSKLFTDAEKEKLQKLKEFLEQQSEEIRNDLVNEMSLVKKLVLME